MIHPILKFLETAAVQPPLDILERYEKGLATQRECLDMAAYLKNPISDNQSNSYNQKPAETSVEINRSEIEKINQLLEKTTENRNPIRIAYRHDIQPYQIWTTRNRHYSIFAEEIHTFYPYLVMIKTHPRVYKEKHAILRVQPISFIMDFASKGDIVMNEIELLGAPFIIETWNEQPMLESCLLEYVCKIKPPSPVPYDFSNIEGEDRDLISQFRFYEIENTDYLRRPVMALLAYYENHDHECSVIHLDGKPNLLTITEHGTHAADSYLAMAAKSGIKPGQGKQTFWEGTLAGVRCELTISQVHQQTSLILRSDTGTLKLFDHELKQIPIRFYSDKNQKNAVYENLDSGIFFIGTENQVGQFHLTLKLSAVETRRE